MAAATSLLGASSRALSYLLGGLTLVLAAVTYATAEPAASIVDWALGVFGTTFSALFITLSFAALLAWTRLVGDGLDDGAFAWWHTLGTHAANGVATLALTYTLLGISLGIGALAEQELSPSTIQAVIGSLTEHFSMAFMTTVVGLPTAAMLRALIALATARRRCAATC